MGYPLSEDLEPRFAMFNSSWILHSNVMDVATIAGIVCTGYLFSVLPSDYGGWAV